MANKVVYIRPFYTYIFEFLAMVYPIFFYRTAPRRLHPPLEWVESETDWSVCRRRDEESEEVETGRGGQTPVAGPPTSFVPRSSIDQAVQMTNRWRRLGRSLGRLTRTIVVPPVHCENKVR